MTLRENLKAVRALIAKGWATGSFARSDQWEPVIVESPNAVCFCIAGAVLRVSGEEDIAGNPMVRSLSDTLGVCEGDQSRFLVAFNDAPGRSQDDVLALIDRAIEAAP